LRICSSLIFFEIRQNQRKRGAPKPYIKLRFAEFSEKMRRGFQKYEKQLSLYNLRLKGKK